MDDKRGDRDMSDDDIDYVLIDYQCGNINSSSGSGKATMFHSPKRGSLREGKPETFLTTAITECPKLGSRGGTVTIPARSGVMSEIGGKVFQSTIGIAEGEVLKIFAQGKDGAWNAIQRSAAMYIRVRRDGPLTKIHITVPGCVPDASLKTWSIVGRYDVLTSEEAEVEGILVREEFRGTTMKAQVDRLFRVEQLEREHSAVPVRETKRVGDRIMVVEKKRRALEL